MTEEPPLPECLACGTCCFSLLPNFVRVTGDDHARLAERAEQLVWFDGIRAFMRMEDGHCAALRIDHGSGRFVCSVYDERPQVCRDLARASGACRGEREAKAERPLIALRARRSALDQPVISGFSWVTWVTTLRGWLSRT